MSTNKKNWTDGEALTTVELARVSNIAAGMDDRAWEGIFTPGSVQKKILPLSEETLSLNPRVLLIPGVTLGAVRVLPALFVAGGVALPNHINMAAKLEAAMDSAALASNSSGSTRYDLIYATISYATSVNGSRKVKDVNSGTVSTQALVLEKAMQIALTVLPNVSNVSPTATMPSDPVDGSAYNFPLCYVTVANGYTAGSALAQSAITPLWGGGWIHSHRARALRLLSFYYGATSEKPSTSLSAGVQGAERWGSQSAQFFGHILMTSGSVPSPGAGHILDNTIDWRNRMIWGFINYLGPGANLPIEGYTTAPLPAGAAANNGALLGPAFSSSPASSFFVVLQFSYNSGANFVNLSVDSSGNLLVGRGGASPVNGTGDLMALVLFASDKIVTGV